VGIKRARIGHGLSGRYAEPLGHVIGRYDPASPGIMSNQSKRRFSAF
jgi:hypothetical protein